jgi:hypothetical protein
MAKITKIDNVVWDLVNEPKESVLDIDRRTNLKGKTKKFNVPTFKKKKKKLLGKSSKIFRIFSSSKRFDRLKFRLGRKKEELKQKSDVGIVNVMHIGEDGNFYLVPAYASSSSICYKAGKNYRKQIDPTKSVCVTYFDGKTEDLFLCDSISPSNFKVNPSLDKAVQHDKEEFEFALDRLEGDVVRKSILQLGKDQMKLLALFFVAGIGMASFLWGGLYLLMVI